MEIQDYARILRRWWKIIAVTTVLGILAAVVASLTATTTYQASTRLLSSVQSRVPTYAQMLAGEATAQRTVDRLGLDMPASELMSKVTSAPVSGTLLIKVTVKDSDAQRAVTIANTLGEEFIGVARQFEETSAATGDAATATEGESMGPVNPTEGVAVPVAPTDGNEAATGVTPGAFTLAQPIEPLPIVVVEQGAVDAVAAPSGRDRNIALGAVVGLMLGVALALVREWMDKTVRDRKTVEEHTEADLIGAIPRQDGDHAVVNFAGSNSASAEAFRTLRTNLQFRHQDIQPRAIVITSAMPGEGKATTAINLALALAETGRNVCLVEADLREPTVAQSLNSATDPGLAQVLAGDAQLEDTLQSTPHCGLTLLPGGSALRNPSELVGSAATQQVLEDLRARFDYVVVAGAPLLAGSDATVLSALSDGAVVLVRHGVTTRDQLTDAVGRLRTVGATVLGAVLTMTPSDRNFVEYGAHDHESPLRASIQT